MHIIAIEAVCATASTNSTIHDVSSKSHQKAIPESPSSETSSILMALVPTALELASAAGLQESKQATHEISRCTHVVRNVESEKL